MRIGTRITGGLEENFPQIYVRNMTSFVSVDCQDVDSSIPPHHTFFLAFRPGVLRPGRAAGGIVIVGRLLTRPKKSWSVAWFMAWFMAWFCLMCRFLSRGLMIYPVNLRGIGTDIPARSVRTWIVLT